MRPAVLRGVPLLAGMGVVVAGVMLGNWQMRRADEKAHLAAAYVAEEVREPVSLDLAHSAPWQRVRVEGEWVSEGTILLDNRIHEGRAGYHLLQPLRLDADGALVLVNRGWLAAVADRSAVPDPVAATGRGRVEGVLRPPEGKPLLLGERPDAGKVWQFLDLGAYRQGTGLAVADWVVFQTSPAPDGLARDWPRPGSGEERHQGYALQWYSLAAVAMVFTGLFGVRQARGKRLEQS